MAGRAQKNNADYFSHDADASSDEKIVYLESCFGLTGYAVYFKLLECMTRTPGFKIQWDDIKKSVYASKFRISVTEIEQIVTECCREEIKAFIFEDGMLFSPGLIKRFSALLSKREYNRQKYEKQKQDVTISVTENAISVNGNTQYSIVKESKVKNIYTSDFEVFWNLYPNKKCGKANTFKSWNKLNGQRPDASALIKAVQFQIESFDWKKDNGQYIPMATTWLNQNRWDSVIDKPIGTSAQKPQRKEWSDD